MDRRVVQVTLLMEYDPETILEGGYKIADPFDWNWQRIIRNTVDGVHYTIVRRVVELDYETREPLEDNDE